MKRFLIVIALILSIMYLSGLVSERSIQKDKILATPTATIIRNETRPAPAWSFSMLPTILLESYYDYMIGGYTNSPVCVHPYGGYFLTYHAKRTEIGQRRVFFSYISEDGVVQNNNELTNVQNWEGYPALAVDPVSGIPIYAWHAQLEAANDPYDIQYSYDVFSGGLAGLFSEDLVVIDNPVTMPPPYNTTDNEYLWPSVQIGPSPTAGMRRVYILAKNSISHSATIAIPSENVRIAYADFDTEMLENYTPLTWSYTSIPELDDWNHDDVNHRRHFGAFTVGDDGRIYYIGYHSAGVISSQAIIDEPDMDVFVCDNFGQGTWNHYTAYSTLPSWNPLTDFGNGIPYLTGPYNTPIPVDQLYWKIQNSGHLNAVIDHNDILHCSAMWNISFIDNNAGYYVSHFNAIKDMVFNTNTNQFSIREIYPICGTSSDSLVWQPWDTNGDGIVDSYTDTGDPNMIKDWNYPYWDETVHTDAMFFNYNNFKITKPNAQGWMAAVWQNSKRAREFNLYQDTSFSQYSLVPEIYISISTDFGVNWSEPIVINSVEVPQFADNIPMWVYPADTVENMGIVDGHPTGKLALMYYDDDSWGAYVLEGAVGPNNGGYVKFMTFNIDFSTPVGQLVTVTGNVQGDIPLVAISNALVSLNGTTSYTTNTDNNGNFSIPDVVPGQEYNIIISKPGYINATGNITVSYEDFDIGTLILYEVAFPPSGISADVLEGNNIASIKWQPTIISASGLKVTDRVKKENTRNDRHLLGYNIRRLVSGMEADEADWEQIGNVDANVLSIQDTSWCDLSQGVFRYAVIARYSNNQVSSAVFSDNVIRYTYGSVTGIVRDLDSNVIPGATVTLNRAAPGRLGTYTATTDDAGQFTVNNVWYGEYNLECVASYYLLYSQSAINVTATQNTAVNINLKDNLISPLNLNATVSQSKSIVSLSWQPPLVSHSRILYGYKIWRLLVSDEQNPQLWTAISGLLTTQYFQDTNWASLPIGSYKYAIKAVYAADSLSGAVFSNPIYNDFAGLKFNRILSCYPSPFTLSTQISYAMKTPSNSKIEIFNLHGQLIHTINKRDNIQGVNFVVWNGLNKHNLKIPSGMYIIKMQANGVKSYQKIVLLK